jgi:hypothetical protein
MTRRALAHLGAGFLIVSCLCAPSCSKEATTPPREEPKAPKSITGDEAIAIAQREALARGAQRDMKVGRVSYESGCWKVFLETVPAQLGGHAMVIVSADGTTVEYFAGR